MKYVSATVLVLIFALCARYSYYPLIGYLVLFKFHQVGNIVRAMDALLAAMLPFNWSGRKTVSNECGDQVVAGNPCRFCSVLCAILNYVLELDHCRKNAST